MDKLHYRGDCRDFDMDRAYGPDRFGAHYKPVEVLYDDTSDLTTVFFKPWGELVGSLLWDSVKDDYPELWVDRIHDFTYEGD